MVAQALAKGARIFVLDEPTAGVDSAAQEDLAAIFESLNQAGATVVLVTHELGPFASLAHRVIVMEPGRAGAIGYDGPPPPPGHIDDSVWHHGHEDEPHDHARGLLQP